MASPLNMTSTAQLFEYTNYFYVASVLIMCKGNDFSFLATYDHKGYFGALSPPLAKRSILQEGFNDTIDNMTEPVSPIAPSLCFSTDLTDIDLEIVDITLDVGQAMISAPEGTFEGNYQKSNGRFYRYGKVIFNTIQPQNSTYDSAYISGMYKFIGPLSGGDYTVVQSPTLPSSNWIVNSVGYVNAMFKTWETETQLVV